MNHRGGAAGSGEAADDDDERQGRTMGERERRGMKEGRKERGGSAYLLGYWSARCRPQTLNRARRDETVSRVLRPSTRTSFRQSPFSSHFVCRVSAVEAPVQCHRRLRDDVVAVVVVVVVVGSPSTDHVVHRKSVTASFRSNNTHTNTQKKTKTKQNAILALAALAARGRHDRFPFVAALVYFLFHRISKGFFGSMATVPCVCV